MSVLRSVIAALPWKARPSATVVKPSPRASSAAALLNSRIALDPATKRAVDDIRKRMAGDVTPYSGNYGSFGTVGEHFVAASSNDHKLAMLQALVRQRGARSVLEIGTAYGISAVALAMARDGMHVTTIEGFEPQATIGPRNIASVVEGVECLPARKEEAFPRLAAGDRRFDLVFHDGGHLGDAYVDDFEAIHPILSREAVYVIDDAFHDDTPKRREFSSSRSRRTCREAWEELVADDRVEGALVCGKTVGILLTR